MYGSAKYGTTKYGAKSQGDLIRVTVLSTIKREINFFITLLVGLKRKIAITYRNVLPDNNKTFTEVYPENNKGWENKLPNNNKQWKSKI